MSETLIRDAIRCIIKVVVKVVSKSSKRAETRENTRTTQIDLPVFYLFNESLRIGQFPSVWKIPTVAPLFKGGSRTDYDNNRLIWVLPCISKIMSESFVNIDLRNFAHEVGLIEQHQFAYSKFLQRQ